MVSKTVLKTGNNALFEALTNENAQKREETVKIAQTYLGHKCLIQSINENTVLRSIPARPEKKLKQTEYIALNLPA